MAPSRPPRKGVQHGPELAQAHYQLGLVHDARSEHADAATAFARAAELQPQMAYAHYMAGMSFYKAKRVDKMAVVLRELPEARAAGAGAAGRTCQS